MTSELTPLPRSARQRAAGKLRDATTRLAARITDDFLAAHPDWLQRYGAAARGRGEEDAAFHLRFLASAVELGSVDAYIDYARWAARVLEARGIASEFLAENLGQVRDALADCLEGEAHSFAAAIAERGIEACGTATDAATTSSDDGPLAPARRGYLAAIMAGSTQAAVETIREALRSAPVERVYGEVVAAAMVDLGASWQRAEVTVADEHRATAVSECAVARSFALLPPPQALVGNAVVVGVEGEHHQFGARLLSDVLEAHGWNVTFLGTNLPARDALHAIAAADPKLVAISTTMLFNLGAARRLIAEVRALKLERRPAIMVGGRAYRQSPAAVEELGADLYAKSFAEALELAPT